MKKHEKTNVMRILDQKKIDYVSHSYDETGAVSGVEVAEALGQNPDFVFKTLVTEGKSREHYVFVIPVSAELDLKKAAHAVGEKSIVMIKSKELLPIGMKKFFKTVIDESSLSCDRIVFSAGKIGYQVEMSLDELSKVIAFSTADIREF